MAIIEVVSERRPSFFSRARKLIRDVLRDYTDQDVQMMTQAALGYITDTHRASYRERQLIKAYQLGAINVSRSLHEPSFFTSVPLESVNALHLEQDRLNGLDPDSLDAEVRQNARSWLINHHLDDPTTLGTN